MWDHDEKSTTVAVDRQVSEAKASDYDGLVLPGGVRNADHLRIDQESVRFVTEVSRPLRPHRRDLPRRLDPHRGRGGERQAR